MVDERTDTKFAAITASYGTGLENVDIAELRQGHLLIPGAQAPRLGLHKATVFKLDLGNRKRLPWAEEYFVPQKYVVSQNIIAGSLSEQERAFVLRYFEKNGLSFPLPH
jgi:hypothetical protein